MNQAISLLVLAGLVVLAAVSFAQVSLSGPIIWGVLAGFAVLGGLVWLRDRRRKSAGRGKDD